MRTAALIGAAVLVGVFGGRYGLLAVALGVAVVATGEILRLSRARGIHPAALTALGGTLAMLVVAHIEGERGPRLAPALIAAVFGLTFVELLIRRDRSHVMRVLSATALPVLTVGLLASYLVAIRGMPEGFRLVAVLVAMVLAAEALPAVAMLLRGGGRVPAIQRIVAGELGVLMVALGAGTLWPATFTWPVIITLGILIGLASPIGRMAADMIATDLRASAGARAPAAVLVRVDGLLLAAPVFFYLFRALTR